jgi:branched-chain amino acid transport system ATP-binding protein
LSGGQQQMLSLVRAWITSPRLVLVDEASMGLAPVVVDKIFAPSPHAECGTWHSGTRE